jgi:hypothetical protein
MYEKYENIGLHFHVNIISMQAHQLTREHQLLLTVISTFTHFHPCIHQTIHPNKQPANHPLIHLAALTLHALTWVQPVFPAFFWVPWYGKQPHAPQK